MRIGYYEQQNSVSAPQIRAPQVAQPADLSKVIGAIENSYEQGVREKEQAQRLFAANEMSRTSLEIDKKYAEIQDRIANGGPYANAEKEFSDFYNKTTKASVARFGGDNALSVKAGMDYERSGVEYGLRLKSTVRARAKSDAAANFAARLDGIEVRLSNATTDVERQAALSEAASIYSQGEASGVYKPGAGQAGMRKLLEQSIDNQIDTDPSGFLADYKANPSKYSGVSSIGKRVDIAEANKIKQADEMERSRIVGEMQSHSVLQEKYEAGTLKLSDIEGNDTEYGSYLRDELVKKEQRKYSSEEKAAVLSDLNAQYDLLVKNYANSDGGIKKLIPSAVKEIREFSDRVRKSSGALLAADTRRLLGAERSVVSAYQTGETGTKGWFRSGPYDRAIMRANAYLTSSGKDPESAASVPERTLLLDMFSDRSGGLTDNASIDEVDAVFNGVIADYAKMKHPDMPTGDAMPNAVIEDGSVRDVKSGPPAAADAQINVPYKIMEDASGNRARVYEDGRIEEIQ